MELIASFEVTPLVQHLKTAVSTLRDSVDDGRGTVWMELNGDPTDADDAVHQYAALVESLPIELRRLWDECEDRCVNVGLESSSDARAGAFRVSTGAIAKLGAIGARLAITVYGADRGRP